MAFDPRGGRLAAGYSEKRVIIWEIGDPELDDSKREPKEILNGHTNDVYSLAYSPDCRWLATASWNEVIIWDTATHKEIRRLGGFRGLIWSVAWCPDPDRVLLAIGGGRKDVGTIELWDLTDLPERAAAASE